MPQRNDHLDQFEDTYRAQFEFYDENLLMLRWFGERMADALHQSKPRSILSLGIGFAETSRRLLSKLSSSLERYVILEGSQDIINQFQSPSPLIEIIHTYFEDWASDEKFDAIEMGFILEHVDDPDLILRSFLPRLKSGGRLFIAVPNAKSLHRQIGQAAGLLPDLHNLGPGDLKLGHKRYYDLDGIRNAVLSAGYKIRRTEGIMMKPVTTSQMQSLNLSKAVIEGLMKVAVAHADISNAVFIEAAV